MSTNLVCDFKLPDGRICGDSSSKDPAMLGRHKRFKHGVEGKAHMSAKMKRKLAEETTNNTVPCFYCPQLFATTKGRSRHITEMHPGKAKFTKSDAALPVMSLDTITETVYKTKSKGKPNGSNGNDQESIQPILTFTQAEFDFQQAVANAAGYLQAKADELAGRDGYVPSDFTRQCLKIIHRQTLR